MDQRLEASRQVRIAMPFSGPWAVLLRRCAAILPRASRSHCACVSLRRHPVTGHGTTAVVPHQPALRFQLLTTVTQGQFAAALAAAQQLNVRTPCPIGPLPRRRCGSWLCGDHFFTVGVEGAVDTGNSCRGGACRAGGIECTAWLVAELPLRRVVVRACSCVCVRCVCVHACACVRLRACEQGGGKQWLQPVCRCVASTFHFCFEFLATPACRSEDCGCLQLPAACSSKPRHECSKSRPRRTGVGWKSNSAPSNMHGSGLIRRCKPSSRSCLVCTSR